MDDSHYFEISSQDRAMRVGLKNDWVIETVAEIENLIDAQQLKRELPDSVEFHCGGLQHFDLSGAWLLYRTVEQLKLTGVETSFSGFRAEHFQFIDDVVNSPQTIDMPELLPPTVPLREQIVEFFDYATRGTRRGLRYLFEVTQVLVETILQPRRLRWISVVRHIGETGISALPIVILMSLLVSVVLAFQSKTQLIQFGAQIFTVDLVSISVLREMGVLLTAILVAGRSGSAFAAEIGVMVLNEEIDALKTMGIRPLEVLVIPRILALLISLPILTFFADLAGLFGAWIITVGVLDIPNNIVLDRFLALDPMGDFRVGMIKAPFFAIVIAIIGTYRGLHVEKSADKVGRSTTRAVVESIFVVIAVDAAFSILFTEIGW